MSPEFTLVLIKPEGVERGLVGKIISRFEDAEFWIAGLKVLKLSREKARQFYIDHTNKDFFSHLIHQMAEKTIVAIILSGDDVVARVKRMVGATDPSKADFGTIRADYAYGNELPYNVVHASDTAMAAVTEVSIILPNHSFE